MSDSYEFATHRFNPLAISEFPKGRKYLTSLSFRGKSSVRPAQVGGFDVNNSHSRVDCSPRTRRSCRIRMGPVEADGAVDAPNAPTAPARVHGPQRLGRIRSFVFCCSWSYFGFHLAFE